MTNSSRPQQAHPKRRTGASVLLGVVTASAIVCGGPVAGVATAGGFKVSYKLTGASPVAGYISYQAGNIQKHQANVPLPWSTEFDAFDGQVLVISAEGPGSITCTISVNGKVTNTNTATGAPARTVCSDSHSAPIQKPAGSS